MSDEHKIMKTPVEILAYSAFNTLHSLHHELHKVERIEERDEATVMAMRVRRIALGEPPIENDPRPDDIGELARVLFKVEHLVRPGTCSRPARVVALTRCRRTEHVHIGQESTDQ